MTDKPFVPSAYQAALFEFILKGKGSGVVIAVAGSGKTKSIERCLPLIPESKSVQLFAFNTKIADKLKVVLTDLAKEFDRPFQRFRANTFHSLGVGVLRQKLGNNIQVDGNKLWKVFKNIVCPKDHELYESFSPKLVDYGKGIGIGALCPDTEETWQELVSHHDLSLDSLEANEERGIELARELLKESNRIAAEEGLIDYADMLYLPILWKLKLRQNDWVFIDESQDTSPVRRALAKLALRPGGRMIAVGDPKQAIYGFTGASHDAIDILKEEFNATELPLTVSYRCPRAIGRRARRIVPYFEVYEEAIEGICDENVSLTYALRVLKPSDAILCRNTKPLVALAYQLIGRGIACHVLGSEIGKGLVNLIRKMKADDLKELQTKLEAFREREVAKFIAKGEEGRAEGVNDRVDCIHVFIDSLNEKQRTIGKLIARVQELFDDSTGRGVLTLSTVHKAKGQEWDRVAILQPSLMPSPYARQAWQAEQEINLMYVAMTRAKEHLMYLEEEDRYE